MKQGREAVRLPGTEERLVSEKPLPLLTQNSPRFKPVESTALLLAKKVPREHGTFRLAWSMTGLSFGIQVSLGSACAGRRCERSLRCGG